MRGESGRAVVLGWDGTLVDGRDRHIRLKPGVRDMLTGARTAEITTVVLTRAPVNAVAADARRMDIGGLLSMVVADIDDPMSELLRLRGDFRRLACLGGTEAEIAAARRAGIPAFGYSGGVRSGRRLRAAGAEAVVSRLDRALTLRMTERRLFAAYPESGGARIDEFPATAARSRHSS